MCDVPVEQAIDFIQKQFLCGVPVPQIEWPNVLTHVSWDDQASLIARTVNFDLVLKYPPKASYQKSFLKRLVDCFNEYDIEVHDDVYDALGRVVTINEGSECFKHYKLDSGRIVTLKENSSIISQGTTGLCTWQAALVLAEWCLQNKSLLKNKTILELGSGIGLTGLTAFLDCDSDKVYLTDCHRSVLETLCENIERNLESTGRKERPSRTNDSLLTITTESSSTIEVLNLPWDKVTAQTIQLTNPDLLLAADVIYDASLFPPLINALLCFLEDPNTKEIIMACTERNEETVREFLHEAGEAGLAFNKLELPEQKNFIWSTECPVRLFSIHKNS